MRSMAGVAAATVVICCAGLPPRAADSAQWTVTSPNGELAFELRLGDGPGAATAGALSYSVSHRKSPVVNRSALGVRRDDQAFVDGLKFVEASRLAPIDDVYTAIHDKRRDVRHRANEQRFTFSNAANSRVDVIARVSNDGVAFRYHFPERDAQAHKLVEESTGFAVPAGASAWIMPHQRVTKYGPAYESLFVEVPSGTTAPTLSGWSFPALFKIAGGKAWLLITESGVDETNVASRLAAAPMDGQYRIRLPEPGEGNGVGAVEPASALPWTLPWRVLIVGDSPATIVESTLVDDLAPPPMLKDTSWIHPGRVSWSWWSDDDSPKNETALKSFVDLSAEMGWEYSLVDANWNLMDPAALQRVLVYARDKKVGILLWYNSGGPHNVVTEQPRDLMHLRDVRRAEFAKLQKWGVKGVKVDFWQSDKQDRIEQYIDLMRDAADFNLLVDFHGCTLPRGWARTYPHFMTSEAVPGAEQYKFNADYPKAAAWHNTVLAFTRNVVGGMDYTPVTFTDSKFPRITTDAHELALAVVFESGLQHFADSVQAYRGLHEQAKAFLKAVPAAWLETRWIGGEPGRLVVLARRAADGWYAGGISGLETAQTVLLDLSFLGAGSYDLTLIVDGGAPRNLTSAARRVTSQDRIPVDLLPRGGFAARLTPAP
jgi:alpha-glucosidase